MASALIENLSAASALATTDLFYVKQAGARGLKATGTQLLALVGTAYVPLAGGTMTGALTIASGTLTASAPALNISQTWTTGATFNALLVNITDTSSAAESLLMDLQVSGASKFSVRKDGLLVRLGGANATIDSTGRLVVGNSTYDTSIGSLWTVVANTGALRANVRSYPLSFGTDVILLGDAANTLALRNGTNQQSFSVYNRYTDPSNYERLTLTGVAGASVNITAETLGTGGDNLDIVLTPAGAGNVKFGTLSQIVVSTGSITGQNISVYGTNVGKYAAGLRAGSTGELAFTSGADTDAVDTAFMRNAAGIVEVNNGTAGTWRDLKLRNLLAGGGNGSYVQTPSMTVDRLADAATAGAGARAFVTDANATTFLSTVAGGGSNKVPVVSNGTNWLIG